MMLFSTPSEMSSRSIRRDKRTLPDICGYHTLVGHKDRVNSSPNGNPRRQHYDFSRRERSKIRRATKEQKKTRSSPEIALHYYYTYQYLSLTSSRATEDRLPSTRTPNPGRVPHCGAVSVQLHYRHPLVLRPGEPKMTRRGRKEASQWYFPFQSLLPTSL